MCLGYEALSFVRPTLQVSTQNDGDFVDLVLLYIKLYVARYQTS